MLESSNRPKELTIPEWQEIIGHPFVRSYWRLTGQTPEELAKKCSGLKFIYPGDGAGISDELYILQDYGLNDLPPLALCRTLQGNLEQTSDISEYLCK
jgi:hypothetical protein